MSQHCPVRGAVAVLYHGAVVRVGGMVHKGSVRHADQGSLVARQHGPVIRLTRKVSLNVQEDLSNCMYVRKSVL